jgi:WXG100 family type VII secretion target
MAEKLFVDPEGLHSSAVQVQGHSDNLSTGHSNADRQLSSAGAGWAGQSAQSLSTWAEKLKVQSTALVSRMDDHSQQMHTAVRTFTESEEKRAQQLAKVGEAADAVRAATTD